MTTAGAGGAADIAIIGGAGHVGLPLGLLLARNGLRVQINDINEPSLETIKSGRMPFEEHGAQPLLEEALSKELLTFTPNPADIASVPILTRISNLIQTSRPSGGLERLYS